MASNESTQVELLSLTVGEAEVDVRLDAYLASHVEGWSRNRLQKLIEDDEVLVNGKVVKPSHKLQPGDVIEIELTPSPAASFTPEDIPLNIVYEDEDLIVINKPAGMVVHPAAGVYSGTLANALAFHFQDLSKRAGEVRPGIVHRLDRGTSGLLVAAKNEAIHQDLADQFRRRAVFKSYVALVHGVVQSNMGRIDQPIGRDPRNRTRMAVTRGRESLTLYRVKQRFQAFTLLDVELKSGRTHQIRVHMAWLKHPVVGDDVYGGGRDNMVRDVALRNQIRKLGRQFLHAERLGFRHPKTGEEMQFQIPLPDELAKVLELLQH